MLMSVQRKLGVFSYELCYCKDTDQTYMTLVPILIETLLGILSAQTIKLFLFCIYLPNFGPNLGLKCLHSLPANDK